MKTNNLINLFNKLVAEEMEYAESLNAFPTWEEVADIIRARHPEIQQCITDDYSIEEEI